MFGSPHPTRTPLGSSSNTAPPPTSAKSASHASVMPRLVLREGGVEVVDHDLPAEDAALLVAPRRERDGGVVHLLVEARCAREALVGDGARR